MNTQNITARRTCPAFLFSPNELTYAKLPYAVQIIDHTHRIFCSITFIQMFQARTREGIALKAILDNTLHFLAVFDTTDKTILRFVIILNPAAGT